MSGSDNISLTNFITSMSGSESLTSFTNRLFHFSGSLGFRLPFDAIGRIELVGGQNLGPEASPRSKRMRKKKEQRKCQKKSDCHRSNREE